ncbi:sodium/proton antiporter (CPA1 family) [Planomicrobium soli]|uniref:Sodium/proton antiporter (CPA1 family) n=1 Tax=Planomicrobium soli TaxID=1176648 RepID=A0A2P8H6G8_9BACL|nr:Na+/H+ antiporter [Planomicrobium soli]PSL41801.1 sodium/proton antiporter (CPA1 family) [Planomicrobium soli]
MDLLLTVLLLLFCLLISNVVSHYTPYLPTALIQVVLGVILILIFKDISIDIETEWFLLLFIAPLLYNDGRHFPREELWRMRGPILGNAIVLVLVTTVAGGYFIHWLIPSIPLAAAFALAAILSPTDPVAVNGIAKRIHIPEKVLNLVRGESLINDASGLVAFNYAVAAVVTGYFSLQEAVLDFSYKFIAGALLGLGLGLLFIGVRYLLRKQGINDVTFFTLLHIMTPFLIFIVTEDLLHASGVIAVVIAGIVHSLVRERTESFIAEEQILTENIWKIILFSLNGVVFLLLGLSIPVSMSGILENPNAELWPLLLYVVMIGTFILGIRFIWAYLFALYEYRYSKADDLAEPNLKTTLFVSLTGVRGTVTMVGVLSIPFVLESGEDFPNRSLILFLAAGTILFTLIVATIILPLLSRGIMDDGESESEMSLEEARRRVLLASINKIKDEMSEENEPAAYELMDEYQLRLNQLEPNDKLLEQKSRKYVQNLKKTRLWTLMEERKYIEEVRKTRGLEQEIYDALDKSLRRREQAIEKNFRAFTIYLQGKLIRAWKRFRGHYLKEEETRLVRIQIGKEIQLEALQAAYRKLESRLEEEQQDKTAETVAMEYNRMISGLKRPEALFNENYDIQKEELRIIIMDMARSEIYQMYNAGQISREQAKELRRYVNYLESVTLHEQIE